MSALVPRSRGEDGGPSSASSSSAAAQAGDSKAYSSASMSRVHSYTQSLPQQKGHQPPTALGRSSSTQVVSRTPTSVLHSTYGSVRTPVSTMNDVISAETNPCSASLLLLGRTIALPSVQGDTSLNRTRRRVWAGEPGGDERGRSGESPHGVCTLDVSSTTGGGSSAASTRSSSSIASSASSLGFSSQRSMMPDSAISQVSTSHESLNRSYPTFASAACSSSTALRRDRCEGYPSVTSPSMPSRTHTTGSISFSSAKGRSTPFSSLLSSSVTGDISRTSALPDFLSLLCLSDPLDLPGKYRLTSQYFVLDSIIQSTAGLSTPVKLPLDTSSSICFEPSIRCALHPPSSPSLRFQASSPSLASQPLCCPRDLPARSTAQPYVSQTARDSSSSSSSLSSSLSSPPPGSIGGKFPSQTVLAGSALKKVLGPHLLLPPAVVAVPLHAPIVLVDRLPVATPSIPSLFFPPSFVSPSSTSSSLSLSSHDDGVHTPRLPPYVPSSYPSRPAPPPPPPRRGETDVPFIRSRVNILLDKHLLPSSLPSLLHIIPSLLHMVLRTDIATLAEGSCTGPYVWILPTPLQQKEVKA